MTFTIPFKQWTDGSLRRVYTEENIKKILNEFKKRLTEGGKIGELEHPDTTNINLVNASHTITGLKYDDNLDATLDVKILDTPCGRMANEALSLDCCKLEPRMIGIDDEIQEIITFDFVKK